MLNDCYSSSLPVISGVLQGSILGPLLCLVYVNDLAQQVLHSDIFLWSSNWKFSFNESKCLLLTFQSKSPTHSTLLYSINGHVIRNCHQHKDFGILMSSDHHGHPISPQSPPKCTKSLDYLTSLCVLVAAYQQRKCSTYHLSDLNLCTVCRFGAHHLLKKLKLLKMYSVVRRNLFLMTTYQITELIGLNSICYHFRCCMN